MRSYRAELHVHTVLSPCAEVEMIPPLIVQESLERGIDIIAITDHNASANAAAVMQAARGTGLAVLPGMELQTQEEVHLLCLFDDMTQLQSFQSLVDRALPEIKNNIDFFGEQFVVDPSGDFIRREERLLVTSARITLEEAFHAVERLGGLAIPAHVDRKAFGLLAILGFIPPDLPFTAIEISARLSPHRASIDYPQLAGFPLLQGGDAHRLSELRGANILHIQAPTISELRLALQGRDGRSLQIDA